MKRLVALLAAIFAIVSFAALDTRPAAAAKTEDGKQIFRFDTFGDEQLWTTTLQMHQAIATVSPNAALGVGLKVDVDALPPAVIEAINQNPALLDDPAVTIQLLKLNAVVGVIGRVSAAGDLETVGITCALCHSAVDSPSGIGHRLDGWPNRDLNVGAIVALSPVLTDEERAVFRSWGRGKYDPRLHAFTGTSLIQLNPTTFPVVIPPAYGLRGVGFETFTGDGPISYWNNYVGVTQMGGHGSFSDERLPLQPIVQTPDLVTPKLPALLAYQLSLRAPAPPRGSFNLGAARRGEELFSGAARCAGCHTPPTFTDVLSGPDPTVPFLHAASEVGQEPEYASRSATAAVSGTPMYRTSPLRGIWQHPPYFHDGSAPDLLAVVNHYDALFSLGLTAAQKADLVEYLKSL